MSDFWVIRDIADVVARPLFDAWMAQRKWVRLIELQNTWERRELMINRRHAGKYMRGKHKTELAELILLINENGGRVVHVMLHRSVAERIEVDMSEWANKHRA